MFESGLLMLNNSPNATSFINPEVLTMDQVQYQHAKRVLDQVHGNKLRASKLLGISRMTLYRLLSRHLDKESADGTAGYGQIDGGCHPSLP